MLYEKDGKAYFDAVNEMVSHSRDWFRNVGFKRQVRKKNEMSADVVKELFHCDKWVLKIYVKYGFLNPNIVDGKHCFLYSDIIAFAQDDRLLDENGKLSKTTVYDCPSINDKKNA